MNFLCLEEQTKVKRLIEQYQSSTKDAGTQTDAAHPKEDGKSQDKVMAELQQIKIMMKNARAITCTSTCNNTHDLFNNGEQVNQTLSSIQVVMDKHGLGKR